MGHLLSVLFHTLRRNLFFFTFIVVVLVSGKWIRDEWADMQRIVAELPSLQRAQEDVAGHQAALVQRVTGQARALSGASVQRLDAQIRTLEDEIRSLKEHKMSLLSPLPEQLALAAKRELAIELLGQERGYLLALRARALAWADQQAARRRLEQLRQAHVQAERAFHGAKKQLDHLEATAGLRRKIPGTEPYRQIQLLRQQVPILDRANHQAYLQYHAQEALVIRLPRFAALAAFQANLQALAPATAPLRDRLLQAEKLAAENHVWQAWLAARPVLPVALGILLGWWLVPAAIRTVFYFVLAPLAARRPPIVFTAPRQAAPASTPSLAHAPAGSALVSAVSKRLVLDPGHELLIRPDYCQSQPANVKVTTRLLFDWRRGLTSIAAHLWMLKRLRAARSADIVVSSATDALDELALLEIGPGDAFVLQPRCLVGVLYETGQRPRIRSHWRLGTLHAWLTLQLRYLAFEGPATLIVKGCRGVRLEAAGAGRTISQDATLGFSANALYATVRAEPFLPYLRGKQALLQDRFEGHGACYLYEEVPRYARPGRQASNPLDMLFDAGMKAFGI